MVKGINQLHGMKRLKNFGRGDGLDVKIHINHTDELKLYQIASQLLLPFDGLEE
jgi:hypothetical protein